MLTLKEDFYIDGFLVLQKGTRKAIFGFRHEDPSAYQIWIEELFDYFWVDMSICEVEES